MVNRTEAAPPQVRQAIRKLNQFCRMALWQINTVEELAADVDHIGVSLHILIKHFGESNFLSLTEPIFTARALDFTNPNGAIFALARPESVYIEASRPDGDRDDPDITLELPLASFHLTRATLLYLCLSQAGNLQKLQPLLAAQNPEVQQQYAANLQQTIRFILQSLDLTDQKAATDTNQ